MNQNKSRKGTRKVSKRTPHGKTASHYSKKKPKQATCARCGAKLSTPRAFPSKLGKMTKSSRCVSRKYGGLLCGKCVKDVEKYKARLESAVPVKRDLTIEKYLPAGWYKANAKVESKVPIKPVEEVPDEEDVEETPKAVKKPAKKKATKKKE
jgi:large subunit ribosomal protein L34e